MKKLLLFLFIATECFYSSGQTTSWSLQKCVDYALQNNINIKQQELNTKLSKSALTQSYFSTLPTVNGSASHSYNYGKTVDRFTNLFATNEVLSQNFYLSSDLTIFNGFQTYNTIRKSKTDYQASIFDLEKMKNDISLSIVSAYLQILYNDELYEAAKAQLEITKQQVELTGKLVDAGKLAKGNLLQIQAQAASEDLQVTNARNQLDLSYLNLQLMLDLQPSANYKIEKPPVDLPPEIAIKAEPDKIFSEALKIQPEIKSAELKVQSSQYDLYITKGMRSPGLSLRGAIGTGYSGASKTFKGYEFGDFDTIGYTLDINHIPIISSFPTYTSIYEKTPYKTQIDDNLNKSFGFYLSIPIFNGLQVKTNIDRAKINLLNAQYNLQLTKNTLNKNIQQAYADAIAALNKYFSTLKTVEALDESYKYIKQKFDVGMVTSTDYNDAKNKLDKANLDLLQSKYDYIFRTKILDFYQGKPLTMDK
ncbi:MAG: TolC family protein [Bacteroidales bacterium]|nr:TolC family protein [Bacteroidales bacterium]